MFIMILKFLVLLVVTIFACPIVGVALFGEETYTYKFDKSQSVWNNIKHRLPAEISDSVVLSLLISLMIGWITDTSMNYTFSTFLSALWAYFIVMFVLSIIILVFASLLSKHTKMEYSTWYTIGWTIVMFLIVLF